MNATSYVTDTHSLVWYFNDSPRLSGEALKAFENTAIKDSGLCEVIW